MTDFKAINDIIEERNAQDRQWGGPEHDDKHRIYRWTHFINKQIRYILEDKPYTDLEDVELVKRRRARYVKIAALALAAIESIDRKIELHRNSI